MVYNVAPKKYKAKYHEFVDTVLNDVCGDKKSEYKALYIRHSRKIASQVGYYIINFFLVIFGRVLTTRYTEYVMLYNESELILVLIESNPRKGQIFIKDERLYKIKISDINKVDTIKKIGYVNIHLAKQEFSFKIQKKTPFKEKIEESKTTELLNYLDNTNNK